MSIVLKRPKGEKEGRIMKLRIFSLILLFLVCVLITGCTGSSKDSADTTTQPIIQETAVSTIQETAASTIQETGSQKNAVSKAKSYLKYTAFSHQGLIGQLEYEGFSTSDATYGADNSGANWNEQAAKKAESYLKYTAFSRQGLIDQLEYEGFTHAQAVYGVDNCGTSW